MKLNTEEIHNIYLHQGGIAEGLLRAGADADFPVMFAKALIEFYELRKSQEQDGVSLSVINHPIGEPVNENKGLNPDSLETIEIELPDTLTDEEIYEILWKYFPISDKEANANFIAVMTHCVRLALRKAQGK